MLSVLQQIGKAPIAQTPVAAPLSVLEQIVKQNKIPVQTDIHSLFKTQDVSKPLPETFVPDNQYLAAQIQLPIVESLSSIQQPVTPVIQQAPPPMASVLSQLFPQGTPVAVTSQPVVQVEQVISQPTVAAPSQAPKQASIINLFGGQLQVNV